jgi:hypothetical protein
MMHSSLKKLSGWAGEKERSKGDVRIDTALRPADARAEKSNQMAEDWVGKNPNTLPTSPDIIVEEVGAHELNPTKLGIREVAK